MICAHRQAVFTFGAVFTIDFIVRNYCELRRRWHDLGINAVHADAARELLVKAIKKPNKAVISQVPDKALRHVCVCALINRARGGFRRVIPEREVRLHIFSRRAEIGAHRISTVGARQAGCWGFGFQHCRTVVGGPATQSADDGACEKGDLVPRRPNEKWSRLPQILRPPRHLWILVLGQSYASDWPVTSVPVRDHGVVPRNLWREFCCLLRVVPRATIPLLVANWTVYDDGQGSELDRQWAIVWRWVQQSGFDVDKHRR